MTTNEKIVASLIRAANGRVSVPREAGLCLAFVRCVIEDALYGGARRFYSGHLVAGTSRRGGTPQKRLQDAWASPWASDVEASMKQLGLAVPALLRKPGDLVFNYRAAEPVGHVGILLSRGWVVENIRPDYRKASIHLPNSISITPYATQPWTLVARLKA